MSSHDAFIQRLSAYKQAIDADIAAYIQYVRDVSRMQFGEYAGMEVDAFTDLLGRGGKRIRGALVMHGYAMCGGKDTAMIVQAARAIEMLHAYMLILDDIQDRGTLRRGKPTVHTQFVDYHVRHMLRGNPEHAGISLAINAAIAGAHAAHIILANLNADPQLKLNAVSITNRTLMITAHGQTYDIMNQLVHEPEFVNIDRVMEWKTALYSFINPLHVGMVLAGGDCHDTDDITPYARHTGKAFQITDDLLGVFGKRDVLGKNPMDDIREGKGTLLTAYALQHASPDDAAYLRKMLGDQRLTAASFKKCQRIIMQSGAVEYARRLANDEVAAAITALDAVAARWPAAEVQFLRTLAQQVVTRDT